jgi:diaminopimelate epimerase
MERNGTVTYSILDPTGNITALVDSGVEPGRQPALAAALMRRHPEVEQVGFLTRLPPDTEGIAGELRMAGGEFCGNASLCAAALCFPEGEQGPRTLFLRVSGANDPVELRLRRTGPDCFDAAVCMPPALEIGEAAFSFEDLCGTLPLVRMQGISHLIVSKDSAFFPLRDERAAAERAVREFCTALGAECLGLLKGTRPRAA